MASASSAKPSSISSRSHSVRSCSASGAPWRVGATALEAGAEVGHVRAAAALAAHRCATSDAEADLVEATVQDVRAVARAVHPGVDDVRRRGVVPAAPGDVLSDGVAAVRAAQVAGAADAPGEVAVGEVVAARHVVRVTLRGVIEVVV